MQWQSLHRTGVFSLFPVPEREIYLAQSNFPEPAKRWHYRYLALEYAEASVALIPDNTAETARRLVVAGSWLKARDREAVAYLFQILTEHCANTELGTKALEQGWFPNPEPHPESNFPPL